MNLRLLKLKTNSYLKRNKAMRVSLPYKQAVNVGVIFSVEDKAKHDHVKEFVRHLEQDGKKVKVMSFLPKNKDNYEFLYDFFTEKDFTFWGNVSSHGAARFAESSFDFLYYLDTTPNPLIMNLMARSKARCRIGKYWEDAQPYFEMMIEDKGSVRELIDAMYKYTLLLK